MTTPVATKSIGPREIVVGCLHYNGGARTMIDRATYERAFLACDGFGKVSKAWAVANCWDWSHVRDASDAAYIKASKILTSALVANGRIGDAFEVIYAAKVAA